MGSKPPALQPIRQGAPGDDFEEDTLLPPPAPGLVLPSADHGFDPPTFPGLGQGQGLSQGPGLGQALGMNLAMPAPLRSGSQAAALHPAPHLAKTSAPQPSAPASDVVQHELPPGDLAPRDVYADPDPTPRTATLTAGLEGKTADALPPLPGVPRSGTATAMLSYLLRVTMNRWQRRRIAIRVEQALHGEAETLDRLLADLGQHAFVEQIDLLALYPPQGDEESPARAQLLPAESWAVRIDAEQLRTLALLSREEARLTSELLQCVEVRRRDARMTQDPALHDEFELLIGRLAAVRVESWVKERARSHCMRQQAQLLSTLEQLLQHRQNPGGAHKLPNLLLLGSLVASQRTLSSTRAIEPWFSTIPGRPAGVELSPALFQPLWRFQDTLLPRAALCARALVERYAYDEELVDRALMLVSVVAVTALLVFAIAWWAITP